MLTFSLSTLISTIIFSNLLILILYFIFKNTKLMISIGQVILPVYLVITAFRLALPFEFEFTKTVLLPKGLSKAIVFIRMPRFKFYSSDFSIWSILQIIWFIGIAIGVYKLLRSYYSFYNNNISNGEDVSSEEPYNSIINEICRSHKKKNPIHIIKSYDVSVPMIFGIRTPYILIPNSLKLSRQELYYILRHECSHFFHHDLWLKFFSNILCIIYWWNPFIILLRNQISTILEIRIDRMITVHCDEMTKVEYLECLIKVAKAKSIMLTEPAISFCRTDNSILKQRFHVMTDNTEKKMLWNKSLSFC